MINKLIMESSNNVSMKKKLRILNTSTSNKEKDILIIEQ